MTLSLNAKETELSEEFEVETQLHKSNLEKLQSQQKQVEVSTPSLSGLSSPDYIHQVLYRVKFKNSKRNCGNFAVKTNQF